MRAESFNVWTQTCGNPESQGFAYRRCGSARVVPSTLAQHQGLPPGSLQPSCLPKPSEITCCWARPGTQNSSHSSDKKQAMPVKMSGLPVLVSVLNRQHCYAYTRTSPLQEPFPLADAGSELNPHPHHFLTCLLLTSHTQQALPQDTCLRLFLCLGCSSLCVFIICASNPLTVCPFCDDFSD